jgi:serine/threonine protein kinase
MLGKEKDINSLKLIDFGLSAKYNDKESIALTEQCGTAIYMAPEIFTNYQYTKVKNWYKE